MIMSAIWSLVASDASLTVASIPVDDHVSEKIAVRDAPRPFRPLSAGTSIGPYTLLARMRSLPATLAAPVSDDAPSADDLQLELAEAFENTIENTMALSLFEANTSARLEAVRDNLLMPPPSAAEESTLRALPAPDKAAAETAAAAAAAAARGRATGLPRPFEAELAENGRPTYRLHRRVQRGAHGEVWRAVRTDDPRGSPLVLKRLLVERGPHVTLSGLRERHFGLLLKHEPLVARFVDAFEVDGSLWLVFKDEGVSLHDLLYTTTPIETGAADGGGGGSGGGSETGGEGAFAVQPSPLWLRFRRERSGAAVLRQLLRQGMTALARLHARNVTHRDLKPANILVQPAQPAAAAAAAAGAGGGASAMAGGFSLRLGDFGSAVDAETLQPQLGLYGAAGPTVDEETAEYQPPEASLFGVPFEASDPTTYDLWSFGIVVLEALLGTPLVISLSSRAEALLQLRLQRARHRDGAAYPSAAQLRRLRLANALSEYCVLPSPEGADDGDGADGDVYGDGGDGGGDGGGGAAGAAPPSCGRETFDAAVRRLDPLAPSGARLDPDLLDLAWRLLRWTPSERLTAADALHHPALLHADEAHTPGDLWDDGKEYEATGMQLAAWLGSSQWWPRGW